MGSPRERQEKTFTLPQHSTRKACFLSALAWSSYFYAMFFTATVLPRIDTGTGSLKAHASDQTHACCKAHFTGL